MRQFISSIITLSVIAITSQSCKKDWGPDPIDTPESYPAYKTPDTANAQPGIYMITYKEDFIKPFCRIYTGSNTIRDAKLAAAEAYERDKKLLINDRLRNPDGSYIVNPADIQAYYTTLVVGFLAQMDKAAVKKFVEDPMVLYVERQVFQPMTEEVRSNENTFDQVDKIAGTDYMDPLRKQIGYKFPSMDYFAWILDSGCDMDHPDLYIRTDLAKSCIPGVTSVEDNFGHGTKVAGVLGAKFNGFGTVGAAPGAPIVPIKVLPDNGIGIPGYITSGLEYVWKHSIENDVINISLSVYAGDVGCYALENAIYEFQPWNIWIAVSAGNEHTAASTRSPARLSLSSNPKSYEFDKFFFSVSSYGSGYIFSKSFSNYGFAVDYASAGQGIYTTKPGNTYDTNIEGTSFACPTVAAILLVNHGIIHTSGHVIGDVDKNPDRVAAW